LVELMRPRNLAGPISNGIASVLELVFPAASVARFGAAVRLEELVRMTLATVVFVGGLFVVVFALEYFSGAKGPSYRSRVFRQDVVYTLFYHGGFYNMFFWAGLANAFDKQLAFLRFGALAGLPGPIHWALYWIAADLLYYWIHRWQHAWGPLWAIHSVHHTQEEMTFATTFRFHPLDQLTNGLLSAIVLSVIGVPTFFWLPLYAAMQVFDAVQHSSLTWGYGRAYRVLVSPRFHSFHHSADPRHHNRNFSKIFSFWDFLFGTAVEGQRRPDRLGVDGLPVPRTLVAQLLAPFRILFRSRRREPVAAATAGPAPTP
jgi:sterol desaturase/sphingolipid hydroxylase (fatty acid hydroxylase superfamily)